MTIHDTHAVDPAAVALPQTIQVDLTWLYTDLQASRSDSHRLMATGAAGRGDREADADRSRYGTPHPSAMKRAIDFVLRLTDSTSTRSTSP
ncbi:hypothetical protein [Microbacterium sp. SA39]|uniref:hypothetical protein n=1 Tax=Microbacterium sp. SA39 TaxID=1263625 RepID=UPI0005FA1F1F|nr:hypothetical protein [Microbacterium sp. SA39]KJQ54244.1 hypothetical protein RS85_01845 [Microbacterium sp. SA39]